MEVASGLQFPLYDLLSLSTNQYNNITVTVSIHRKVQLFLDTHNTNDNQKIKPVEFDKMARIK